MSQLETRRIDIVLMCTIPVTAQRFYLPLARELEKNGYSVTFCFADGIEARAISSEGFQVKKLSMRRKPIALGNALAVLQLAIFLKKKRIKLIETSTPVASVVGRLAATIAGVPTRVNTVRGMFPAETHRWQSLLFDLTEMVLHRTSSYTVTINEKDRQELLDKGFAEQDRITNIGGGGVGVDLEEFNACHYDETMINAIKKTLSIREDDFVVTFMGRLTVDKGILDFIEVLSVLVKGNHDIKGLVVGDVLEDEHRAVKKEQIEAIVQMKGISERFALVGHRSDVPELMAISDVIVLPSKREGFGMVLAEAAAMANPVVAYRCRGVEQAVVNGKTGFVIEPGDIVGLTQAIQYLYGNRAIAREIGLAARHEAEKKFDQAEVLKKYLNIYKEATLKKL